MRGVKMKRRILRPVVFSAGLIINNRTVSFGVVQRAFGRQGCRRWRQRESTMAAAPESPADPSASLPSTPRYSNFWYSAFDTTNRTAEISRMVPHVPNLDFVDGWLPDGAYSTLRANEYEPKPICRVSTAIDLEPRRCDNDRRWDDNGRALVTELQQYVDAGWTSFTLRTGAAVDGPTQEWAERHVYGRLLDETPRSVMQHCNLMLPTAINNMPGDDSDAPPFRPASFRQRILESLSRLGPAASAIDTLQLQCPTDRSGLHDYALEGLDVVRDLQRDGWVRSVSTVQWPVSLLQQAQHHGLTIDFNQVDANLFDMAYYLECASSTISTPLIIASPLAGGLLTDRHAHQRFSPLSFQLTPSERRHVRHTLPAWVARRFPGTTTGRTEAGVWTTYQRELMSKLQHLAQYYRVSVADVVLRWTLQINTQSNVVGTMVASSIQVDDDTEQRRRRPKMLRAVFTFELNDADMDELWDLAGGSNIWTTPPSLDTSTSHKSFRASKGGLFLP